MPWPGTCTFIPQIPLDIREPNTVYGETELRYTGDKVHRDENRTQRSELGEHLIDLVVRICHLDTDLGEVIRVRARQDLFVVVQVLGHCNQVVLNVRQI